MFDNSKLKHEEVTISIRRILKLQSKRKNEDVIEKNYFDYVIFCY